MGLTLRRLRPPAPVRSRFGPTERMLAMADTPDSAAVASTAGLWLEGPDGWRRLGWETIVKASWLGDRIEIIEGDVDDDGLVFDSEPFTVLVTEPRNLPLVVRQRVEASIVKWEQIRVPGGTARLVGRKVAGRNGLLWTARPDSGTAWSPAVRDMLVEAVRGVREQQARRDPL